VSRTQCGQQDWRRQLGTYLVIVVGIGSAGRCHHRPRICLGHKLALVANVGEDTREGRHIFSDNPLGKSLVELAITDKGQDGQGQKHKNTSHLGGHGKTNERIIRRPMYLHTYAS
jgi:hypothetical protein